MNFKKSSAVPLFSAYLAMAFVWPPRLETPGPMMPGSGATSNLPTTATTPSFFWFRAYVAPVAEDQLASERHLAHGSCQVMAARDVTVPGNRSESAGPLWPPVDVRLPSSPTMTPPAPCTASSKFTVKPHTCRTDRRSSRVCVLLACWILSHAAFISSKVVGGAAMPYLSSRSLR